MIVASNRAVLGTCSVCGGPVSIPTLWEKPTPPVPICERCGAIKMDRYGPVIPMIPRTSVKEPDFLDPTLSNINHV